MLKDGQAAVFRCVDKCPLAHHFKKQQNHAALLWKILHICVFTPWYGTIYLMQTCKLILVINIHYDIKWHTYVKACNGRFRALRWRPPPDPLPPLLIFLPASRYKSCTHPAQ